MATQEDKVKRTANGGRIYEQTNVDDANRTDLSGIRFTKKSSPIPKPTIKQRVISIVTLGLR